MNQLIRYFLQNRKKSLDNKAYRHAKLIVSCALLTCVFDVLYVVVSVLIDFPSGAISQGLTFFLFIILCFLFKYTKLSNLVLGNLYAFICFQTIVVLPFYSGGITHHSIILPWLTIIPAIALLLTNKKSALIWLATCISSIVFYSLIDEKLMPITYNLAYDKLFSAIVYGGLISITLVVNIIFYNNKSSALSALENANSELDIKNKSILSSINYSKRIQDAMLPDIQKIQQLLPQSFILFQPRDVVSGDFYWLREVDNKIFIAAVDCTGHGVPGAFMSLIGNNLLNDIVSSGILSTEKILEELHKRVNSTLNQKTTKNRDGMDLVLCMIDPANAKLEFSGAKNPLIYIQENENGKKELHRIRGDKHSIGGISTHLNNDKSRFTKHIISLEKETALYLFSDGYQDQFCKNNTEKFKQARMRDIFLHHCEKSFDEQHNILKTELDNWMGNEKQIDDILIIGLALQFNAKSTNVVLNKNEVSIV